MLLNFKCEILGLPFDEQSLNNGARYMRHFRKKKLIMIIDGVLCKENYIDPGEVSHLQILLLGQLLEVLLQSLCGLVDEHTGISKKMQELRQKYYFSSIATYARNLCIEDKRIHNTRITLDIIHIPDWDLGPEDFLQFDLLAELPPCGVYETLITAVDFFSRKAFAHLVFNPTAVNTANFPIDIMTRHAYLPTLFMLDKGSVFVSQVIHVVAATLGTNLKHATTKHAKTTGVLERAHATIKTSSKLGWDENKKKWHINSPNADINYNTTYLSSIDCEPSRIYHGLVPHNVLNHNLVMRFNPNITPTTGIADQLHQRIKTL